VKEKPNYIFNGVRVASRNEVYVSSSIQQLNEDRIDNMVIHHYQNDRWTAMSSAIWACAGMWPLFGQDGGIICVATEGEVIEFPRKGSDEDFVQSQGEHVDLSPDGPSKLVHLRCVEQIGSAIYCAGFARRVYRRKPGRVWVSVDAGTFVPRQSRTKAIGFLGIAGLSEEQFYAVGLDGEIWSCSEGRWTAELSPTNLGLNTIAVLPSGLVCIGGMVGVVIYGRAGQWDTLQQDLTKEPFWGSAVFQGKVYLANNEGVFVLDNAFHDLKQVYAASELVSSTSYLDARDGVMWSVGEKAIVRTDNGHDWHNVPAPPEQP
jgi:hypothetical protein